MTQASIFKDFFLGGACVLLRFYAGTPLTGIAVSGCSNIKAARWEKRRGRTKVS